MLNINKILELIQAAGYKFEKDFAHELGISQNGWLFIKKRKSTAWGRANQIAQKLGVEVKDIMDANTYEVNKYNIITTKNEIGLKGRLMQMMESMRFNTSDMARDIGVSVQTLSSIISRDSCHIDILQKIALRYRWLDMRWLITGEGEMRGSAELNIVAEKEESTYNRIERKLLEQKKENENIMKQLQELKKSRGKIK